VLPLACLPPAIGVALARHRLYDLETLIDRTLLAAALAAFVTLVFFAVIVRVLRRGEPLAASDWQSKKARTLLKILLAYRGRPVTREQLMEFLWPGEDPAKLSNRLSVALTALRTVLGRGHDAIRADPDAVALNLEVVRVDVERFLDEVEHALADSDRARLARAERLYCGDFLQEDPYDDWARDLREHVREAYASAVRARARLTTDHDEAVRAYLLLLEHDRWDAGAHRELIARLERAGRHGHAIRRRRTYIRRMHEIGVAAAV